MNAMNATGKRLSALAAAYGQAAGEAIGETLWPTRCAVCDAPGEVLCGACRRALPYLDWWRACPRCGAPMGRVQCTECNDVTMAALGRTAPPFDGCASATVFDDDSARVVRTWKDAGERRLAREMARAMAAYVPPAWRANDPVTVPIPASTRAVRTRGFDHGAELAGALGKEAGLPVAGVLAPPRSRDQRALSRAERVRNLENRFRTLPGADAPACALLVDDVYTTGSTLFAATDALRAAGTRTVYCLTFARVW